MPVVDARISSIWKLIRMNQLLIDGHILVEGIKLTMEEQSIQLEAKHATKLAGELLFLSCQAVADSNLIKEAKSALKS
ncbi:hypothetical protein ES288_D02G139300v1 [Gossypium darwinii]|uniref:Uncharacterized protein n=1 Tax=Gossypium darwinii TaxID=34276 RepID=A0A5D2DGF9_GOSDA|nr:hypothetical protein ES288_D02G139300v1 [Gossypium darwinii]